MNKKERYIILIDGGPASGKNTLAESLVKAFYEQGEKAVLIDHDTYVNQLHPSWTWDTEQEKEKDLSTTRDMFIKDIDKNLRDGFNVIAFGLRFFTIEDVKLYTNGLQGDFSIYLFHLSVPFELRKQRLHARGPHTLIDLESDQRDRDAVVSWPGYVYSNTNSPEVDTSNLIDLIAKGIGRIDSHMR